MWTITVTVSDREQAIPIIKTLETLPGIVSMTIIESVDSGGEPRPQVDAITRISEASLAQAWNSPEDDIFWDVFDK